MIPGKPQIFILILLTAAFFSTFIVSCKVIPKDYPANKPFVYETNINIEGNLTKDEKATLHSQLKNQLDDSIRVRTVYKLFYKGFNRSVLQRPPVYDSAYADKSVTFMKALLNSRGYFRNIITYDTVMHIKADAKPPQFRTTVIFNANTGKLFTIDSVSHVINHSELQTLTDINKKNTLLKKGRPFSKQLISEELNRLVGVYRDNGYLRFSFDELAGVWDTLNLAVLRPSFDPMEQLQMINELQRRADSPTADIEIRLRPGHDVEKLKKYYVGHTEIFTDYNSDTTGLTRKLIYQTNDYSIYSFRNKFKSRFIAKNVYFHRGDLYNQKKFLKTIGRFNELGAWKLVNIEQIPRPGTDTVDFSIFMTPAEKYSFSANLEGSSNSSFLLGERLLGIGVNVQLLNRNFGRTSNHSSTNIRYGTEVQTKGEFVQTRQASISHSIFFPKPIPNSKLIPEKFRDNFRSVLSFSLGNMENKDFFNLTSLNASWGYDFRWKTKKDKPVTATVKFPSIEYAYLIPRPELETLFVQTPIYRTIFNTGLVVSLQGGLQFYGGKGNASQIFRVNFEESGMLINYINLKALDSLFRFIKIYGEFIRNISYGKNSFVFRTFVGAGFAFKTRTRKDEVNLPFFKQYYAGGPNSMRAWGLRLLGPGSTVAYRDSVPLRFGDFQFETNVEYRFPIAKIGGYLMSSCLFTDIGNVWFLKSDPDFPDATLTAKKLFEDLAVGIGTGLRIDFEFFKLSLDYGLKVRNPTPEPVNAAGQNKWFYNFKPFGGIVQLGINYPFAF